MTNRLTIIKDLIMQACERLRKAGVSVDGNKIEEMIQRYHVSDSSIDQIKFDILRTEKSIRTKHEIDQMLGTELEVARNLQNLSVQYKGITVNNQDIDLMLIATSSSFEELEAVLGKITNISAPGILENEGFIEYRQRVFDSYLDSLSLRTEYIANPNLDMSRKLEYLSRSGVVTAEEMAEVNRVIAENAKLGHAAMVASLKGKFGEERVHEMLSTLRDFSPIEKTGIKGSSLESFQELHRQISYFYDSLTIDEEGKYGKLVLQDGTFEGKHLRKSLDFAKSMGKSVRINTLMFYMDCPEDIYGLEESTTASLIAKEKLSFYVDKTTELLSEYPGVVRSVDIFNELLNRHPVVGDVPYMLRSDFPQVKGADGKYDDNTKAGWLKHLTVEDICDIMVSAREKLPDMDFMYNDDFLTDPRKMPATIELIQRIQERERFHGIKLIDSIGTQMHLDNNISKEEIRQMFISLSELGLPIEITEFDLAMTSELEGLTPEQVEIIRQKKINEVYEVVEELRDQCNIRGFTIWSKTDRQNFRVTLANEIAHSRGEGFIDSLHGGMFTEGMIPKSASIAKKIRKQNFNYHGHTRRCGHTGNDTLADDLYVIAARNQGLSRIGFSDHVAFSTLENWQQGHRMHISEVEGYIASIRKLQKDNPDMVIRCGFEAEYDPTKKGYLAELRESCDYMILGQHYIQKGMGLVSKKDNPDYPLIYAKSVCEAMETGIYDIFAHPDYFMLERSKCMSDESYALFMENARTASYMICKKAKEMGIPLELNVRGAIEYKKQADGEFSYPHSLFWNVAAEVGNEVIYGVDSHHPCHIMSIDEDREFVGTQIDTSKLNLVSNDYDPVKAREENLRLQEAYDETLKDSVTHETSMVQMLMSRMEVSDGDDAYSRIGEQLSATREKFIADSSERIRKVDEKLEEIENNSSYSEAEKQELREKYKLRKQRIIETCEAREGAIDRATISLSEAREIGCETKDEYVQVVGYLTESKTATNPMRIDAATNSIDAFKESKTSEKTTSITEAPKQYVYTANTDNNSSGNNSSSNNGSSDGGFAGSLNLLIVIGMLLMFGIILSFIIR